MERDRLRVDLQRTACPFCKDAVRPDQDKVACDACMAWHHSECWADYGACSACRGASRAEQGGHSDSRSACRWQGCPRLPDPLCANELHLKGLCNAHAAGFSLTQANGFRAISVFCGLAASGVTLGLVFDDVNVYWVALAVFLVVFAVIFASVAKSHRRRWRLLSPAEAAADGADPSAKTLK